MQLVLAGICFGISAFLRNGSLGIGLGLALGMYFLNIIANLTSGAEFLKYITPFGFADVAAGHFLTIPDWLACDWRPRYASADIYVDVDIQTTA